jgi:HD superfamily phosphohydrolase
MLKGLTAKLSSEGVREFLPKQINDPIWGTVELLAWEVALLDTPLLQRMRGIRQLGLAQPVFPGANHGRFEHIIGVVAAIEEAIRALSRQIGRWNLEHKDHPLPAIEEKDRYALRLAALFHDIGHGPFSHALEPVLEAPSLLGPAADTSGGPTWRQDVKTSRTSSWEITP